MNPKLSPQAELVRRHLHTEGSISAWEAQGVYRIRRLASRIDELVAAGFEVTKERRVDATGQTYLRYSFSRAQRKSAEPILPPRPSRVRLRIEQVVGLYEDYCRKELRMDREDLIDEVRDFKNFIEKETA